MTPPSRAGLAGHMPVTFINKCGSIKFFEKMRPAKTKRFFTHCFGRMEIKMYSMDANI